MRVAGHVTEGAVEVTNAVLALFSAKQRQKKMSVRHKSESHALLGKLYGRERVCRDPIRYEFARPDRDAQNWARIAEEARVEISELRELPLDQVIARIEAKRAAAEASREAQVQERMARTEQTQKVLERPGLLRNGLGDKGPMRGL